MATKEHGGEIGDFLRGIRTDCGVGVERAAQAAGVNRSTLYRWEQGLALPRLLEMDALLTALRASPVQKRQALTLINAPRAETVLRKETAQIGEAAGIGPRPSGGDLLRSLRLRRKLTTEAAASALGITTRTLRAWEQGQAAPPPERMTDLLPLLGARPEEQAALRESGLFYRPSLRENAATVSQMRERCRNLLFPEHHYQDYRASRDLGDLLYLTYIAQAWSLARRDERGRRLLAELCANYADYLMLHDRLPEAERYAVRALELMANQTRLEPFALHAAVVLSQAVGYRQGRNAPMRGLQIARQWLPLMAHPVFEPWLLACQSNYLALMGDWNNALETVSLSYQMAMRWENPRDLRYRRRDKAALLFASGQPAQALPLLTEQDDDQPLFHAQSALTRSKIFMALGETSDASIALAQVFADISAHDLSGVIKAQAEELALKM